MGIKNRAVFLLFSLLFLSGFPLFSAGLPVSINRKTKSPVPIQDTLSWSVGMMKKVFNSSGEWYMTHDSFQKTVKGILDYTENDPVDTIVVNMNRLLGLDSQVPVFNRKAENIPNKSIVPGYLSPEELEGQVENRRKTVADSVRKTLIQVPDTYLSEGLSRVPLIQSGDPHELMPVMDKTLPGAFMSKFYKGWANTRLPQNVTDAEIDTLKTKLFNWTRQTYNDSLLFYYRDSLIQSYRDNFILQMSAEASSRKRDFLLLKNRVNLNLFNESEIGKVNDSLRMAMRYLTERAAADSTLLTLTNHSDNQTKIWTANHPMTPMRIFLKNEQNDSLSVILYGNGKGGLKLVISDGVKFSRLTESQKKEITFTEKKPDGKLRRVNLRHVDQLPWKLLGTGAVGFSQSALSNWAKGGESSLSLLLIGRYSANYSKKSLKWENLVEFRLGIFNSKTRGLEKNDDKLEFQSRLGYSAFKKWYYSAESNFRTQVAYGYKYPDKVNPISAFMSPGYLTFSIGMDYKPNKSFSLFISPITSKTTFVKDTALIDPTHFGVEAGHTRFWEPGAIVKLNYHWPIVENITYDTRAEVFNNYRFPFQKFNVDWEQTLVMQVTQHISTRIMSQVIYDYNVKFPIKDETGKQIAQKAKWQFKELFTVGFNYKF